MQDERRKKAALWREQQIRQKLIDKKQGSGPPALPKPAPAFMLSSTSNSTGSSSTLSMQATSVGTITHTSTAPNVKSAPAAAPARVLSSVFGDEDEAGGIGGSRALRKLPPLSAGEPVSARARARRDSASESKGKARSERERQHERERTKLKPKHKSGTGMSRSGSGKPSPSQSPKLRRNSASDSSDAEDPLEAYMKSLQAAAAAPAPAATGTKAALKSGEQVASFSVSTVPPESVPASIKTLKEEPMDTDSGDKQDGAASASAVTKKPVVIMTGVAKKKPEAPAPDVRGRLRWGWAKFCAVMFREHAQTAQNPLSIMSAQNLRNICIF